MVGVREVRRNVLQGGGIMREQPSSKELVPGPKQPPRLHGEGCICGDYIRHDCPVKHRKPSKQAQQEHAAAWHRLVVSIATILEVNPNGSLEEIGNEIAGAIQQLRATARVCREDAEMNAARAERAEQKLAVTSNRQAWLQFSEYARQITAPTEYDDDPPMWRVRGQSGHTYRAATLVEALRDFWDSEIRHRDPDGNPIEAEPAPAPEPCASVTRLPVRNSYIAPISDRVDELVNELQRQGMRTLRASFKGMTVRIDPDEESGRSVDQTSHVAAAPTPRGSLPNSLGTTEGEPCAVPECRNDRSQNRGSEPSSVPSQPPEASPNEGPIVNGFVQVSDGVLPQYRKVWLCAQCGCSDEYVKNYGCPESCGRTAQTKGEDR
jgi:hypothetical protein